MAGYRIKLGLDQPLAQLVDIVPQPASAGVRPTRRTYAAAGSVLEEGLYVELEWNVVGSIAMYQSILSQFGLGAAKTSEVTIHVVEYNYAFNRFSGTAVRPELGRDVRRERFMIRNLVILVRDLRYATG